MWPYDIAMLDTERNRTFVISIFGFNFTEASFLFDSDERFMLKPKGHLQTIYYYFCWFMWRNKRESRPRVFGRNHNACFFEFILKKLSFSIDKGRLSNGCQTRDGQ